MGFPFRISPGFALIQSPMGAHGVSGDHVHDGLPFPVPCACTVCASIRPANPNPKSGDRFRFLAHAHSLLGRPSTPGDCSSAPDDNS